MCSIRQRFKSTPQQKLGKFFFSLSPCVYELPGYFFSFYDFIFFCSSVWVTCVRFLYFIFFFSGNFVFISFFFASLAITLALSRRVYACWNLSLAHRKSFCFALFVSVCVCSAQKRIFLSCCLLFRLNIYGLFACEISRDVHHQKQKLFVQKWRRKERIQGKRA